MSLHVVLGKGPVGSTLTDLLVSQGHQVRVLSRSGGGGSSGGGSGEGGSGGGGSGGGRSGGGGSGAVEHRAVDAADPRALTAATSGAAALYNCASPAYHRWAQDWPPIADALLTAAEASGAVLVIMSNLYGYGPVDGPMTEDLPLAATSVKGRVRAAMWEKALARHEAGALRAVEARASDFVGPGVVDGGYLGARVVPRVLAGKRVSIIGDPDRPHTWTALDDVAASLVVLATDERAWGRPWNVPSAPPVSQREAVAGLCRAAGVDTVKVASVPHLVIRGLGLAMPAMRELEEIRYQFVRPFVLDSRAFTETFGLAATPLEQTWTQTVQWWRDRQSLAA